MEREPKPYPVDLTGIHINLKDHTIEFEDRRGTVGRLVFTKTAVLYEGQPLFVPPDDEPDVDLVQEELASDPGEASDAR